MADKKIARRLAVLRAKKHLATNIRDDQMMWVSLHCNTNQFQFSSAYPQQKSHRILMGFGRVLPVGGGQFICTCGVIGKPVFHRDMGQVFVISSTCGCPWATWGAISAALDAEGAA